VQRDGSNKVTIRTIQEMKNIPVYCHSVIGKMNTFGLKIGHFFFRSGFREFSGDYRSS